MSLLKRPLPLYVTLIIVTGVSALFILQFYRNANAKNNVEQKVSECPQQPVIKYNYSGYTLVNPLLLSDGRKESDELSGLKLKLNEMLQTKMTSGEITAASVYMRMLNESEWISLNDNEVYYPASLIKVPVLMVFLHDIEKNPALLHKQIYFDPAFAKHFPTQSYAPEAIVPGNKYTIEFLLNRMASNSDNASTLLLNMNLNVPEFKKLFVDLGLPEPDVRNSKYEITASGYSRFFRVLYNSSYLTREYSEYAVKLLSKGEFKNGIAKSMPPDLIIAHKFGEYGEKIRGGINTSQLHESGIFYYKDQPYLLTVMTKGTNPKVLSNVLADVSGEVYRTINQPNN